MAAITKTEGHCSIEAAPACEQARTQQDREFKPSAKEARTSVFAAFLQEDRRGARRYLEVRLPLDLHMQAVLRLSSACIESTFLVRQV